MNKQEAIEEILKINHTKLGLDFDDEVKVTTVIDIISQIYEPQKPVIPKFVAELIQYAKIKGYSLYGALETAKEGTEVFDWLFGNRKTNQDTFAQAWLFGYEIEQEQLYMVEIPNPNNTSPKYKLMLVKGINGVEILRDYFNEKSDRYILKLTEAEIKKDFEWAWQWAESVEGTND